MNLFREVVWFLLSVIISGLLTLYSSEIKYWIESIGTKRRQKRLDDLALKLANLTNFGHEQELELLSKIMRKILVAAFVFLLFTVSAFVTLTALLAAPRLIAILHEPVIGPPTHSVASALISSSETFAIGVLVTYLLFLTNFLVLASALGDARFFAPSSRENWRDRFAKQIKKLEGGSAIRKKAASA